jgi:uncharacterized protein (DUF427 family)
MAQDVVPRPAARSYGPPEPSVEPTERWIRVRFGGEVLADSRGALLLIQYGPGGFPTYYFPQVDVRMAALEPAPADPKAPDRDYYTVRMGDKVAERGAWIVRDPAPEFAALRDYVSFDWGAMDGWYEEEEEIFVHARDPHHRVDVLPSSRHVRVVIAGQSVADTQRPHLLFETRLPTRYYIPPEDVRMDLLDPTHLTTRCPYKGVATYWTARIGEEVARNVVWCYADPIPECPKIKGLLCFFNERVDLYVDGELQERPRTPWSR